MRASRKPGREEPMDPAFTMICTADFAGLLRGKGVPSAEFDRRVAAGIGWTPTNVQITCFDSIAASPYGALGDLVLRPDPATRAAVPLPDGATVAFALGDISHLDGAPWECCTRGMLKAAADRLREETGLELRASFEHEFMLRSGGPTPAFSLAGFAEHAGLAEDVAAGLAAAGIHPDSFLREYGPNQFELTLPPAPALEAADRAARLRAIVRMVARARGAAATFTPLLAPDLVGNGVHIHFSLWDRAGAPVTYDPAHPHGLSAAAGAFAAGVLAHAPGLVALTAPSAISALRLTPHRWSAAFTNLGRQDREACLRICPLTARDPAGRARQYNLEFRAADAAAAPHLALAALIHAGLAGLRAGLPAPLPTEEDLAALSPEALAARGLARLPASLDDALAALAADPTLRAALPEGATGIYIDHKRGELAHVAPMAAAERFAAYAAVY